MKLLILASHPVQYHAPMFRAMAQQHPDCQVVYLSDFSVQGYRDSGFGTSFAWDEPLLEGYPSHILNPGQTQQPRSFWELKSPGWQSLLQSQKPTRILVHSLNYQGAIAAVLQARLAGIPCSLRVETNDVAFPRSGSKQLIRDLAYRGLYSLFDSAIAIGSLNRDHLASHGIPSKRIGLAYYCLPDRFQALPDKQAQRQALRQQLGFTDDQTVILFSGKLIPKKNPQLILEALARLTMEQRQKFAVLYLGSGELETELQTQSAQLSGLTVHFAGFKNQLELPPYYLAADTLVLPSNRAGETWGLVVNEAHHAGLPCIVTQAVGCGVDFQSFPDFQIIPERNSESLAAAFLKIQGIPRDFHRYDRLMTAFSIPHSAQTILDFLLKL